MKLHKILGCLISLLYFFHPTGSFSATLFQENFENTNFASRGWYDSTGGALSTTEHISGSTSSFECRYLQGTQGCNGGGPGRHLFTPTDEVYASYWVKYSANYTGSNRSYHPHEFYILTNENTAYVGPAYTYLTVYIEQNEGTPLLGIQDGQNIDLTRLNQDLINTTENRAVAGCNGTLNDGYTILDCYPVGGGVYLNGKEWRAGQVYFGDTQGPYYKNNWHHVEAYFKLNSIVNGKGVADGIIRYWYDGNLIIESTNVILRTGQHLNMKFNQFMIGPYIGDGSPVDQTMWVDDLTVGTSRPTTDSTPPSAPSGLR